VIIAFESHTQVMRAYKVLPEGKIIPTPRRISKSCGLSINIDGVKDAILGKLKEAGIPWAQIEVEEEQHLSQKKSVFTYAEMQEMQSCHSKRKSKKPRK